LTERERTFENGSDADIRHLDVFELVFDSGPTDRASSPGGPEEGNLMLEDLRAATEWAAGIFDRVDIPRQVALPTPCAEWDVGVLMIHVVAWNRLWAAGLLALRPPDDIVTAALATSSDDDGPIPDIVGSTPGHAYRTSIHELLAVFSLDDDLTGTCKLPIGELPAGTVFTMAVAENITHGWDLAVATGQDAALPDHIVVLLERAAANLPIDRTRGSLFDRVQPVPPRASRQQGVLAYLGRRG
jgi:uncharacterized protein (TIGR03086 family)